MSYHFELKPIAETLGASKQELHFLEVSMRIMDEIAFFFSTKACILDHDGVGLGVFVEVVTCNLAT